MDLINAPGVYTVPSPVYHSDIVETPSLSHSIVKLILTKSLRHAMWAHPRLTPEPPPDAHPTKAMDDGTILHRLILGRGEDFVEIAADDWRTKAAQNAAIEARAAGKVPVLLKQIEKLCRCADAAREQIREHPDCADFYAPGRSELMMVWQIGPVWCRALADRVPDREGAAIFDIKTTIKSASPEVFQRTIERDHATGAAFYLRGAAAVLPGPARPYRFVVVERDQPYAISVMECGPTLIEAADIQVQKAVRAWATAMILDEWPGYPATTHFVEASIGTTMRAEEAKLQWSAAA